MSERRYETARIDELEGPDGWSPIRLHFDVRSFGVNAWTAHRAGEAVIDPHDEVDTGHEEMYFVTSGRATFTVDGEEIDAPPGTIVFVRDPQAPRGAVATEPETVVVTAGGKPGEAFRPQTWETNRDVLRLFDRGDYAGVKRLLLEALPRYEDKAKLYYNLACAEAQLGETDEALEHLRRAVADAPALGAAAPGDDDLAPLRADRRFGPIVNADESGS
jgi:hypothetical protein